MTCIRCKKEITENSVYCQFCGRKQIRTAKNKYKKRGNGSGSIIKISGNRRKPYNARITVNGKQISIGYYSSQSEAQKELNKIQGRNISDIYNYTLQQFFDMLIDLNKDKLTKSGLTNYVSGYKYLEPYRNIRMREMRTINFQEAINKAAEQGVGYATWKKIQNVSSLLCKLAMANDVLEKNYALLVTLPQAKKKDEKPSFSKKQLEKMWQLWQNDKNIAAILAMCYIGVRINEFLDLKKEHVNLEERVIFLPGSKTEAGKNRIIPIPNIVLPIFQSLINTSEEYLFPSPTGKRWDAKNFRDRVFYRTLEKYSLNTCEHNPELKITPHSCRHTYAYLCVKYGVDQKATMDLMGHTKYSTSAEIYAEATKKDIEFLRSEADKIGG